MPDDNDDPRFAPVRLPLPTRGSRHGSLRSRASGRAVLSLRLAAHPQPVKVRVDSILEANTACCCAARPDAFDLIEQPPAIRFSDGAGRSKMHTYDFLFIRDTGERIAIVVKPWDQACRPGFQDALRRIRAATPLAFVRRVVLVTDRDLRLDDVWNAMRLQEARRRPDGEADARALDWLRGQTEPQPLHRLHAATGLGARAWPATVRLVFAGQVRRLDQGRIGLSTRLVAEGCQ